MESMTFQLSLASALATLLYALAFAAVFVPFRNGNGAERGATHLPESLPGIAKNPRGIGLMVFGALILHTYVTALALVSTDGLALSLVNVCNVVALVVGAMVFLGSLNLPTHNLYLLVLPTCILNLLALLLVKPGAISPLALDDGGNIHVLISLSAYSALMGAAIQSILLAVQERQLKNPRTGSLGLLPPLETMERLLIGMLWFGLILLTASIVTGLLFLQDMMGQRLTHHTVLTSASWCIYAVFLFGHHVQGWRGTTAVHWTLSAFALLLLGYVGSKFVLEYLL